MTVAEEQLCWVAKITANMRVEWHLWVGNAETEANTWGRANMDYIVNQQERVLVGITWNKQMPFKTELSCCWIKFQDW